MTSAQTPKHEDRAHALLSASGAQRWMACTPSARLEDALPETTSVFAEEGTFAHELAEVELRKALGEDAKRPEGYKESPHYAPEMEGYLLDYVDTVMERIAAHRAVSPDAVIQLEERLDFSRWVPEGFGTGDVVIISDLGIEVIDLKYGKGVAVEAEDNPQLKLYALGALDQFEALFDVEEAIMTIVQPRLDSISSAVVGVKDLVAWGDELVRPAAVAAWEGKGNFRAGEHCRFCKLRTTCRARAEANTALAALEFAAPASLSNDEIAGILPQIDELVRWASDVKDYALEQARDHQVHFPGWKLVEGRSNRRIDDELALADVLQEHGHKPEEIFRPPTLQTLTALERAVGKKRFSELAGPFISKPPGRPTLVPESDKRPAMSTAADDFSQED